MPYTTVSTNDVLTASHFNANYRDQVISQVTSATRPSGVEGQVIYEADTDSFQAFDGTNWVEFGRLASAGTWTPTVAQGASTNISKTVTEARYVRIGNIVFAWCHLQITGSGTAGSAVSVTLPVTASGATANSSIGAGSIIDSGTAANSGPVDVWLQTSATAYFLLTGQTARWGQGPNAALASGDSIRFHVMYTVA